MVTPQVVLEEIKSRLRLHRTTYFETITHGNAGQGDTCEYNVFQIPRNNDRMADYKGWEIKTTGERMKTFRPFTLACGGERAIQASWGALNRRGDKTCFNRSFKVGQIKYIPKAGGGTTKTEMILRSDALVLLFDDNEVGQWSLNEILQRTSNKMANLCIINSRRKKVWSPELDRDIDYYNYHDCKFYGRFDQEAFLHQIREGRIIVEFRIRGDEDKGTCFKMSQKVLSLIYGDISPLDES